MGELVVQAAAIFGGVLIFCSALWRWLVRPAFVREVQAVVKVELGPVLSEFSMNGGRSVKDTVNRIDERTVQLGRRLEDHIASHRG